MDNKDGYSWETIARIQREMGLFTSKLLFCYPSEIERNLSIIKSEITRTKDTNSFLFILNTLKQEAENILKKNGFQTDLKILESIKDYDPLTGEEAGASIQVLNARQILLSVNELKKRIGNEKGQEIFIETLRLLSATVTANAQYVTWLGIRALTGKDKGRKTDKLLPGVIWAIDDFKTVNRKSTFGEFWKTISHHKYTKKAPFKIGDYSIYTEGDRLFHTETIIDKRGNEVAKIKTRKKSAIERYFYEYVK